MENLFEALDWAIKRININGKRLSHLKFPDDSPAHMKNYKSGLAASNKLGLKIIKTKLLKNAEVRNMQVSKFMEI